MVYLSTDLSRDLLSRPKKDPDSVAMPEETTQSEVHLKEIHDFLIELARQAGEMIISGNPLTFDTKQNCMLLASTRNEQGPSLIER